MEKLILHGEEYNPPVMVFMKKDFRKVSKKKSLFDKDIILNMDELRQSPKLDIVSKYQYYTTLYKRICAGFGLHIESGYYGDAYEKSDSLRKRMWGTQSLAEEYARQGKYEEAITEMDSLLVDILEFYKNIGSKTR